MKRAVGVIASNRVGDGKGCAHGVQRHSLYLYQYLPLWYVGRYGRVIVPHEGLGWVTLPDDPIRCLDGRQGRSGIHWWEIG